MKRAIIALTIAALVGAGIYFALHWKIPKPYGEKIFPDDTLLYLSVHDLNEAAQNLHQTLLWKKINSSSQKEEYRHALERGENILENFTGVDLRPLLAQFNHSLSAGLFSIGRNEFGFGLVGYIEDEKAARSFIEQQLDPSFKRRFPDLAKTELSYSGKKYYKYTSETLPRHSTPCYLFNNHNLVFTQSEPALRFLLDIDSGKRTPLSESVEYNRAKKTLNYKRGVLLYVNGQRVLTVIENAIPPGFGKYWPAVVKITGVGGLESLIYNSKVEGEGFEEQGYILTNQRAEGLLKIYLQQQPQQLASVEAIPPQNKIFSAGTIPDLGKMWDEVNTQLNSVLTVEQFQKYRQGLDALRNFFNFDVRRDLLDPIGNQFSFSYEPQEGFGRDFSRIKFLVVLHLDKPDQFKQTLDRLVSLAAFRGIERSTENYKGKNLEILKFTSPGYSTTPSYYLESPWFYAASDSAMLKRHVDARVSKANITDFSDYKKVTSDFPGKVNSLAYTNLEAFARMYPAAFKPGSTALSDPAVEKYQQDLNALAKELFGSASYAQIRPDGIYTRSYSSIPAGVLALLPLASNLPEILQRWKAEVRD